MGPVRLFAVILAVLATMAVAAVFSMAGPLAISCAPGPITELGCHETVTAAMERGLAPFHPLVLSAHVDPGETAGTRLYGHRATVTFDLLGVPGATTVAMYYDSGGHWYAVPDRRAPELAAWALLTTAVLVAIVMAVGWLALRRHRKAPGGDGHAR